MARLRDFVNHDDLIYTPEKHDEDSCPCTECECTCHVTVGGKAEDECTCRECECTCHPGNAADALVVARLVEREREKKGEGS